jgi:hypothetical protein
MPHRPDRSQGPIARRRSLELSFSSGQGFEITTELGMLALTTLLSILLALPF